jgi:hypothetical protein
MAAALTNLRNTPETGGGVFPEYLSYPIAAAVTCHQGGIVELSALGLAQPAGTAGTPQPVVGVCIDPEGQDVSTGASSLQVKVAQGVFQFNVGTGIDALTQANVGGLVYAINDNTIGASSGNGLRAAAGTLVFIDSAGLAWCQVCNAIGQPDVGSVSALTGGATVAANTFVTINASGQVVSPGTGGFCIGVLKNAVTAGSLALVQTGGIATVTTGGAITAGNILGSTNAGLAKVAVLFGTNGTIANSGSAVCGIALTTIGGAGSIQCLISAAGGISQTTNT